MNHRFKAVTALVTSVFVILVALVFAPAAQATGNAVLRLSPLSGQYTIGNTFTVNVLLDSPGVSAAAAQSTINYSSNLQFTAFSEAASVLKDTVTSPDPTTANGSLFYARTDFSGVGYTGTGGQLLALTFMVLSPGAATITFNMATPPNRDTEVIDTAAPSNQILGSVQNGAYTAVAAPLPVQTPTPIVSTTPVPEAKVSIPTPTALPVTGEVPYLPFLILGIGAIGVSLLVLLWKNR